MAAGEVDAANLQIAAVDVALVERDAAVYGYLFEGSSPHGIVLTLYQGVTFTVGEGDRAIFRVVDGAPDAGISFDKRLVAISIELRLEGRTAVFGDSGVLVELICLVHGRRVVLQRELSITNVVIGVLVVRPIDRSDFQLGAAVVSEGIVHNATLAGGIASGRAAKGIVAVLALYY